ncbi:sugar transferase [Clostridium thermobutyricum]|uniref:sugar transferase n=1 Tax=Clostridium thermobutyricum TaxID=29372 RepID=UPI003F52040F
MERLNKLDDKIEKNFERKENGVLYLILKRFLDVFISIIAIILLSPIFIVILIAIKVDSKGKIVFGHKRLGKDRKEINVYKFRTMVENADEIFAKFTEEQKKEYYTNFKLENDPRITKVGDFLRKTSLDELPQLFNILRGDMSLVGPRPIVEKEVDKYGEYADKFFSVIPGLTGYWQANGRSDTTYEERVQMDMYYIDNASFIMDIKIIFKTITSVLKKEGAI